MIAIIGFHYRKYTHYTLYGSCPLIYGIDIIRSLLFLFLAHFHESANIRVAIKSGSTVHSYFDQFSSGEIDNCHYFNCYGGWFAPKLLQPAMGDR